MGSRIYFCIKKKKTKAFLYFLEFQPTVDPVLVSPLSADCSYHTRYEPCNAARTCADATEVSGVVSREALTLSEESSSDRDFKIEVHSSRATASTGDTLVRSRASMSLPGNILAVGPAVTIQANSTEGNSGLCATSMAFLPSRYL